MCIPIVACLENRRQELAFIFKIEYCERLTLIYLIYGSYCELLRIKNHMVAFSDLVYGIRKDVKVSFKSSDHRVELKKVPEIVYSRKMLDIKLVSISFLSRGVVSRFVSSSYPCVSIFAPLSRYVVFQSI